MKFLNLPFHLPVQDHDVRSQNNLCGLNYTVTEPRFASTKTQLQHFPQD